jgi:hypothetical protein
VNIHTELAPEAGAWLDTSYLGARRGKYAGIGDTYDADLDEFVSPALPGDSLESE